MYMKMFKCIYLKNRRTKKDMYMQQIFIHCSITLVCYGIEIQWKNNKAIIKTNFV